jgi:hypothetical protein
VSTETIAPVRTMPGVRLVAVKRLSFEQRMRRLENLARTCLDRDAEETAVLLAAWAHDSLSGPQLERAWEEVVDLLRVADKADRDRLDWDWACNSCGHRTGQECGCTCCPSAADEAEADAAEALAVLAGGTR